MTSPTKRDTTLLQFTLDHGLYPGPGVCVKPCYFLVNYHFKRSLASKHFAVIPLLLMGTLRIRTVAHRHLNHGVNVVLAQVRLLFMHRAEPVAIAVTSLRQPKQPVTIDVTKRSIQILRV